MKLRSVADWVKVGVTGELRLMREKRGVQAQQVLVGLQSSKPLAASIMAAPVQRRAMAAQTL